MQVADIRNFCLIIRFSFDDNNLFAAQFFVAH